MPQLNKRRGFFDKLSKNLDQVDKRTLLRHLEAEADSNQNWARAMDRLEEGVLIITDSKTVEYANPCAEKLLGPSILTAKPFWVDLGEADLRDFFEEHLGALQSEVSQVFKIISPREKNLKILIQPKVFKNPTRHLVLLLDLTHPLLPEVERLARNRFDAVIRLAGGLAHEIGNPLNALSLHTEILKKEIQKLEKPEKDKLGATVEILQSEISRLDRIVRNFLKTTRRTPLRFQMRNLSIIIHDVIRFMKPALEEHDIKLISEIPEKIEFFLDEDRIRSVFVNLIQNAIDAMPNGGELQVLIQTQGQSVTVQIRDNGHGISKEDLPHIFEAYYTTKKSGSGLGLLFVYDAIMDHGGKIHVQSRLQRGTTFEITMPLRRSNLQIKHDTEEPMRGHRGKL